MELHYKEVSESCEGEASIMLKYTCYSGRSSKRMAPPFPQFMYSENSSLSITDLFKINWMFFLLLPLFERTNNFLFLYLLLPLFLNKRFRVPVQKVTIPLEVNESTSHFFPMNYFYYFIHAVLWAFSMGAKYPYKIPLKFRRAVYLMKNMLINFVILGSLCTQCLTSGLKFRSVADYLETFWNVNLHLH